MAVQTVEEGEEEDE